MSDVSISEMFDAVFGFEGVKQRNLALQQYSRFELVQRARKAALSRVIDDVERAENASRQRAEYAVNRAILRMEGEILKIERKRCGVVGSIQMKRRYAAFLRIDDKAMLLKRIEQTMAFIEARIKANNPENVAAMYESAAVSLLERARRLDAVRICPASDAHDAGSSSGAPTRSRGTQLYEDIAAAFDESLGEGTSTTHEAMNESEFEKQIQDAFRAGEQARARANALCSQRAQAATGRFLEPCNLPKPITLSCELVHDRRTLQALLDEVRTAFTSYARCVQDGGLFCAFGSDSPYGSCRGYRYEDYDLVSDSFEMAGVYTGSKRRPADKVSIPELVEEDPAPGGDRIEVTIERMREFNANSYQGILDENPGRYVDAFWYGLKKLVQFTEESIRFDRRIWTSFVDRLQFAYSEPASDLAAQLDTGQLKDFLKQVRVCAEH